MAETLSRRSFLFYGGATLAGVTLGEFGRRQLAHADEQAAMWRATTTERWAVSVCRECPAACGVRVRVVNDVPVKLDGNPRCPIARGRLCAKGQAAVEGLLDPDRLVGPARRVGARGDGRWESIPWDTAIGLLAAPLREAAASPGAIVAVAAHERGPVADAWTRFWAAAGARLEWTPTATASQLRDRFQAITGVAADPHFDLEHATYVLSAGAPLVEDWLSSPLWTQRAYGRFRRGIGRARGRLVQLDSRRSMTARKADEWIVVDPDRQPALVYGLIAVLLRENRIDRTSFGELAGNLDEFEQNVTARFTPDEVAAVTGVPVVTILRLARDLIATPRPLVVVSADADPSLVDAVLALNGLIGAFDRPGGIFAALPPVESMTVAEPIEAPAAAQPRLVVLRDSSALRTRSTMARTDATVRGAAFVVSFSPFLDESSEAADLLMPVHTALESWHAVIPAPAVLGQAMAVAAPAVAPRLKTQDLIVSLRAIASSLGGALPAACPWSSTEELVTTALGHLASVRRGAPYTTSYESDWIQQLERGGWWTSSVSSRDQFAAAALDAGGWADPFFEPGQTRRSLRDQHGLRFVLPPSTASAASTDAKRGTQFPLTLRTFTPAVVNLLGSANQPGLFELLGQPEGAPWRRWVELHPETAREAGLEAGARARVESGHGSIEVAMVLVDGMPRDTVALSFVPFVPRGGRWARMVTGDLRSLWPAGVDPSVAVAVRVTRA